MSRLAPTTPIAPFSPSTTPRPSLAGRFRLEHVPDDALHTGVKTLAGRYNVLTADLLAHLAEVDARGIYRERACSSLYTYCVYELRLSEDEAQRRTKAARTAREFPALFEMLAEGAIHLTGLLLLAPYLTRENQGELLARARFRTKREIEHLVAEIAPRPDAPARIEPLGPRRVANLWQAHAASLRGPVRELASGVEAGQAPPVVCDAPAYGDLTRDDEGYDAVDVGRLAPTEALPSGMAIGVEGGVNPAGANDSAFEASPAPARIASRPSDAPWALVAHRYRVEFTASRRYVELLEEARDLLQHQVPNRDVARVHELAMEAFVAALRKRRRASGSGLGKHTARGSTAERVSEVEGAAPVRVNDVESSVAPKLDGERELDGAAPARIRTHGRYVPAGVRRAVWERDEGRCTFEDSEGRRCRERAGLEIHHEHAFALGGATTLENLRLLCRGHNALFAELDFGRAHIERKKLTHGVGRPR